MISGAIDMCGSAAANPESGAAPRFGWVCRSQGSFKTPSPPPQKAHYAVVLFDGFAPLIATLLVSVTGNPLAPAFYVMTGAALSAIAVLTMKERLNTPLD